MALGTALAFDTGVFLVVVGITAKMVMVLGRSSQGLGAFREGEVARYAATVEEPIEAATLPPGTLGPGAADGSGKGGTHAG